MFSPFQVLPFTFEANTQLAPIRLLNCGSQTRTRTSGSRQVRVNFSSEYTKDSYGARVACSILASHVRLAQMYRSISSCITSQASSCVAERVSSSWSEPRSPAKAQQGAHKRIERLVSELSGDPPKGRIVAEGVHRTCGMNSCGPVRGSMRAKRG